MPRFLDETPAHTAREDERRHEDDELDQADADFWDRVDRTYDDWKEQ